MTAFACIIFLSSCNTLEKETKAETQMEAASVEWVEEQVDEIETRSNSLDDRLAKLEAELGNESPPEEDSIFTDVTSNYWAYHEIMDLYGQNIIKGYPELKLFYPEKSITRYQAASMMVKALNLPLSNEESVFVDVTSNHPGIKEIMAVYEAGIFKGSDGAFLPNEPMKRRHMAMVLQRAFNLNQGTEKPVSFSDVDPMLEGYDAINLISQYGIAKGNEAGQFMPENPTKRSHFSAFVYRALQIN